MLKLASLLLDGIVLLLIGSTVAASSFQSILFGFNCSKTGNYTPDSTYQYILYNLLGTFTSQASKTVFYNYSLVDAHDQVYGLYMCRGDIVGQDCSDCVSAAKDEILSSCPYSFSAIIWYDNCLIRYSQNSFFGKLAEHPKLLVSSIQNVTGNLTEFSNILGSTMSSLAVQTSTDNSLGTMYGTRVVNVSQSVTLYAMEQCTNDLTKSDCYLCLTSALQEIQNLSCGFRVLTPSCVVRYEFYPFFSLLSANASSTNASSTNTSSTNAAATKIDQNNNHHHSAKAKKYILLVLVSIASIGMFSIIGICICIKKKQAVETSHSTSGELDEIKMVESLHYEWNMIKGATHNFSSDRKLGEGGFGEVYKGILEDGQEVAVKRLSENSAQGIVEFKTEIIVVAKLQHKNLVKLLGFCLAPREKILVYEYLPNSSLDRFVSDKDERLNMSWEIRFKIIAGVAKGLLYLHEDSRLKIVHRDLKLSNILLDEDMNPKIADFGLAKLFRVDQTQGDTKRIVGTYGYMAPEYAMSGHFSAKSDVYSFGVIVLEIVSGQRNRVFGRPQHEEALLHRVPFDGDGIDYSGFFESEREFESREEIWKWALEIALGFGFNLNKASNKKAWRLWKEGSPSNLIDTLLDSNYPMEEVIKCVHIGLLCIQDNAIERPRMASVVAALNGQSISLPMPKAPTFFGDPRTTETQVHYNQLTGNNDIIYHQPKAIDKDCPYIYTGTQGVTDVYPR